MLAENFVERGGGRRQAGACQVRQQSYTEFSATDVKGFYLKLVLEYKKLKPACSHFGEQAGKFYAVIGILSLSSIPRKNRRIFIFSSMFRS